MSEEKRSKVELIKEESSYLAGPIADEINNEKDFVSDEAYELLKFHGSYQGYDRDTATERKKAGLDKEWEFMVRMKAAGGRISADQYLALDGISEKYANGTLRITTRETFQFHCIIKENLKNHIAAINEQLLTTMGGCGDVVRNVMCSPAPIKNKKYRKLFEDANAISEFTMPKTDAYHEIWLDGKNVAQKSASNNDERRNDFEPLYGSQYLPRKFKIGIAIPEDNSIDVLTHDLGIVSIFDKNEELEGYNIYIGGGLGMTHNKPATYPRLASAVAFVEPDKLLNIVAAVVKLHRDHGDRGNRKHARLKYVVEENGVDWSYDRLCEYMGFHIEKPRDITKFEVVDHMGWHEQGDGKFYLGVPVSSGRIVDSGDEKVRTGLYKVIEKYKMDVILTADQNLILCDIEEEDQSGIEEMLKSYGIKLLEDITSVYRNALACVSLPTCGKALAEAERTKKPMLAQIEDVMKKHSIIDERISVRIAGCPNGCSRPYVGDIGVVGRMPGHYALFIGGDFEGTRLSKKILDRVPSDNVKDVLDILFEKFVSERNEGEGFGDFANRFGESELAKIIEEKLSSKYKWARAA